MATVKMGFSGLSVTEQIERTRHLITKMTGNANYTTPKPTLVVVGASADALESAYNASRGRDKNLMIAMRLRRKEMLYITSQLAAYVQEASEGDEEIILSSGFDVRKRGTPGSVTPGVVYNVRLSDGSTSGKIRAEWNEADNAINYVMMLSDTADFSNMKLDRVFTTTKLRKEFGGLNPGSTYWVKVIALGREEFGTPSEAASIIAR
jgi:hypothetical protein